MYYPCVFVFLDVDLSIRREELGERQRGGAAAVDGGSEICMRISMCVLTR